MSRSWIHQVAGLHKNTGAWALCLSRNPFNPQVYIDSMAWAEEGGNALAIHEVQHAAGFHALWGLLLAPTIIGYIWWRRHAEWVADCAAYEAAGKVEFSAFIYMHTEPRTRWQRWVYRGSRANRLATVVRWAKRRGIACR